MLCIAHYPKSPSTCPSKVQNLLQTIKGADYHHCPNLDKITEYLTQKTGWDTPIAKEDICITCYKSHIAIIEEEELKSYDSELITLIDELKQEVPSTTLEEALICVIV